MTECTWRIIWCTFFRSYLSQSAGHNIRRPCVNSMSKNEKEDVLCQVWLLQLFTNWYGYKKGPDGTATRLRENTAHCLCPPTNTPSSSGMWVFSPFDPSGDPASWMISQSLLTCLSYPFISWFLLYFLPNILILCKWSALIHLASLSRPADGQSSDTTTTNGSHIVLISPWLLLSNLRMSSQLSASNSHIYGYIFTNGT